MAYQGIDSRDLYRKGSGLTLRRLWVLIQGLPWDSPLKVEVREAHEKAKVPTPDKIRDRQEHYRRLAEQQAKEAG